MEQHLIAPEPLETLDPALPPTALSPTERSAAIAHHMAALEELADPSPRGDGWTPYARRLFLQTLAETGRVTVACDYARLSKQSAYALRARDPLFAAGWDAACELARMPLADALYEQALDGLTETVTRDDGRTMTRHRVDSRLSIAVLGRLDRRCDRAAEQGSRHVGAVAQWEAFTAAIGRDDQDAAKAILEPPVSAKLSQASQLRDEDDEDETDEVEKIWWDEQYGDWRTSFPPPHGFDGKASGLPGRFGYSRALTEEEQLLVDYDCATGECERLAADTASRDSYFNALRAEVAAARAVAPSSADDAAVCVPAKAGTQPAAAESAPCVPAQAGTQSAAAGSAPCVPAKAGTQPAADGSAPCVPAQAGTQSADEGSADDAGLGSCLRRSTASLPVESDHTATTSHPDVNSSPSS